MKRFPTVPFILILTVLGAIFGFRLFYHDETARFKAAQAVRHLPSDIRLGYTVTYTHGPIARESLTFVNDDGASRVSYEGANRAGTEIARFTQAIVGYDVTFLFDKVVQDGVWELTNKPPRTDSSAAYEISIYQLANGQSGSRRITFTDPDYWATTGGRQFKIHLDKNKPLPDLLKMESTSLIEPRYKAVVSDFEAFGPVAFRKTLDRARAKLKSAA